MRSVSFNKCPKNSLHRISLDSVKRVFLDPIQNDVLSRPSTKEISTKQDGKIAGSLCTKRPGLKKIYSLIIIGNVRVLNIWHFS